MSYVVIKKIKKYVDNVSFPCCFITLANIVFFKIPFFYPGAFDSLTIIWKTASAKSFIIWQNKKDTNMR